MTPAETIDLIDALRAKGATRIKVGDVEVEFAAAPRTAPASAPPERLTPEAQQMRAREREEAIMFAACG